MKTIWKFYLPFKQGGDYVSMPVGAKVLSVGNDPQGQLCAWAEVDSDALKEQRFFVVIATGKEIPRYDAKFYVPRVDLKFYGTVLCPPFVWHVYGAEQDEKD